MDVLELVDKLKELGGKSPLSSSDKLSIEVLYNEVLGHNFIKTSCNDCYHDAVIEMYSYLKKYGKMKEKSNYALKNGVLLQMDFGSGEMFTNDNLTDEAAEKFLAKNPKGINQFALAPPDWEERVSKRMNQSNTLDQILVSELVTALKVEGATTKTVKDVFKAYLIDGKKISVKVLDSHMKEAKSVIEAEIANGGGENTVHSEKEE